MRWRILACFLLIAGVASVFAPAPFSPSPAVATIPEYGAPTELDGSPLGGGTGYTTIYSAATADYVVSTAAGLKTALASASPGQVVYVADGATITLNSTADWYSTGVGFYVKAGVTLAGGRGGVANPGIISLNPTFYYNLWYTFIGTGTGAEIAGLVLKGNTGGSTSRDYHWRCIRALNDVEVHNNEIYDWGPEGVYVGPGYHGVWIHHNYFHHIWRLGSGYSVEVNAGDIYNTASALVEGNRFDYYRHAVMHGRGRSSSVIRYNWFGSNQNGHAIDMHGQNDWYDLGDAAILNKDGDEYIYCAGDTIEVYNNTFIDLDPPGNIWVRGLPYSTGLITVNNNWFYCPETCTSVTTSQSGGYAVREVSEFTYHMPGYGWVAPVWGANSHAFVRMTVEDNWWGESPPPNNPTPPPQYPYSVTSLSVLSGQVASNSAILRGFVGGPFDNQTTSAVGFVWDTVSRSNPGNVSCNLTDYAHSWMYTHVYSDNSTIQYVADNLTPDTVYHMRFAVHWNPWEYGEEVSFTTSGLGCVVIDSLTTGADSGSEPIGSDNQSFESILITDNVDVNYVYLRVYRVGSPTNLHVYLYNENTTTFVPEGAALAEGTYDVSAITTDNVGEWIAIPLDTTVSLTAGLYYDLVVTQDEPSPDHIIWITTTTDGPGGYYAYSTDNGANWTYDAVTLRDGLYELRYCDFTLPGTPEFLHIIDITATTISLAWQEQEEVPLYYRIVYNASDYPANPFDGTLVGVTQLTSITAIGLEQGTTYYFGVWGNDGGLYSPDAGYVAATTSAGDTAPDYGPDISGGVNATILSSSPLQGFIQFVSVYGAMPEGTVGLLGYSAIFLFVLVGVAAYNRSVFVTIGLSAVGLVLGYSLGVYSWVFLVIAVIVGVSVGVLRGGQPSGG